MARGISKAVDALGKVLGALEELEGQDQQWVIDATVSRLGLPSHSPVSTQEREGAPRGAPKEGLGGGNQTAKAFMRSKNAQSDVQRVACLAYFLNHNKGATTFNTKDLAALNVEAAGTRIGNLSQAVANATRQSQYFAPAGGGKKQITSFGEEVVDALPDQEKVKQVEQNRPRKRKANRKKTKGAAK